MGRQRGRARGAAVRAQLPRLRRRLGRAARRRARRLRVGLERAHEVLQRPRLGAYLEQSTRYIAYDAPMPGGGYRYYRDAELGPEYDAAMDSLFDTYRRDAACSGVGRQSYPRADGQPEAARARAVGARRWTCSAGCCRPPRSRTWGSSRPDRRTSSSSCTCSGTLAEAHATAMICAAMKAVMPSFALSRRAPRVAAAPGPGTSCSAGERRALGVAAGARGRRPGRRAAVRHAGPRSTATRSNCSPRCCSRPRERARADWPAPRSRRCRDAERGALLADLHRRPRQPPPPSRTRLRGAALPLRGGVRLRRLRRSPRRGRMLTVQWQGLTPDLGAGVPRRRWRPPAEATTTRAALDDGRRIPAPR